MSVSHSSFSAFWQAENAISAHSSTGLISQWFWIYLYWDSNYLQLPTISNCKFRLLE